MNIVLVHGILGFREKFGLVYFNGVQEHLEKAGHKVLVPQLDATGPIHERGEELRGLISKAFSDGTLDPAAKAHIIGHSQGGLDSRFMLSPGNSHTTPANDLSGRIASLSTIGSPHHGSPIADLLAGQEVSGPLGTLARVAIRELLEALGINPNALFDLETGRMREFNRKYPDHPEVRYFSVAGKGRAGVFATSGALLLLHRHIKSDTGEENDGLVSVSSAERWGASWPAWPADHADEIGHDLNRPPDFGPLAGFDYLGAYDAIVTGVRGQG